MISDPTYRRDWPARLIRAWLVTAVIDGLFSSILNVVAYHSTVGRLFQGVASVVMGARALEGGLATAAIGVLMHFGVALTWSAIFLAIAMNVAWLRRTTASWSGVVAVAAVYGPLIWVVMSLVVMPAFTHRPTPVAFRWWVQLAGHWPFVGVPIVGSIARPRG